MATEDINYATVVFKKQTRSPPKVKREEETVYSEVKVKRETIKQTSDTDVSTGFLPDNKANNRLRRYRQLARCLGILCVILLLGIIAVGVYVTRDHKGEQNELKENRQSLLAAKHNLTKLNNELSSENENLRRDHHSLTVQFNKLTQSHDALQSNITQMTAENQELKTQNKDLETQKQDLTTQNEKLETENKDLETQKQDLMTQNEKLETKNKDLETQNQKLETQKKNLTETIQDMKTKLDQMNVSRAQWSIDAHCPLKYQRGQRKPCQDGWELFQSSCYLINKADGDKQKTWAEAQANCRRKDSDLAVLADEEEKEFIRKNSLENPYREYLIGLRVQDRRWKWVDGRDLTESISPLPYATDGHCAVFAYDNTLRSVNCGYKKAWICKKKSLSV